MRRIFAALALAAAMTLAFVGLSPLVAFGGSAGNARTSAATHRYIAAVYAYQRATAANAAAIREAAESFISRIDSECAGVITAAPRHGAPASSFARKTGEEQRLDEQVSEIEDELGTALRLEMTRPNRIAERRFDSRVKSLRWGDRGLAQLVKAEAIAREEGTLRAPVPNACADMRSWAASGYRTLPAGTKAFMREREAQGARLSHRLKGLRVGGKGDPFKRYENAHDKALLREARSLETRFAKKLRGLHAAYKRMDVTLGFAYFHGEVDAEGAPRVVAFAKGVTAAGKRYVVSVERESQGSEEGGSHGCELRVQTSIATMSTSGICLAPESRFEVEQNVQCEEGALLHIEALTSPTVRRVRLRLSDGRTLTSVVSRVPASLGGSASDYGIYVQEVRGPKPIPVSLAELNSEGRVVKTLMLNRVKGCTRRSTSSEGLITSTVLARGRVPNGPGYSVQIETMREPGTPEFSLGIAVQGQGGGGESLAGSHPKMFRWAMWQGCSPHPYVILYGVLRDTRAAVFAHTPAGYARWRHASIPARFHVHGELVYLALATVPSEIVVRDGPGRTLVVERLGRRREQAVERCEGESELSS